MTKATYKSIPVVAGEGYEKPGGKPGRKPKPAFDHEGVEYESVDAMCKEYGIKKATYLGRIAHGWSVEEALTKSVGYKGAKIPVAYEMRKGRKPTTAKGLTRQAIAVAEAKSAQAFIEACGLGDGYAIYGSIDGIIKRLQQDEKRALEYYEATKARAQKALAEAEKFREERLKEAMATTGRTYEEIIKFLTAA